MQTKRGTGAVLRYGDSGESRVCARNVQTRNTWYSKNIKSYRGRSHSAQASWLCNINVVWAIYFYYHSYNMNPNAMKYKKEAPIRASFNSGKLAPTDVAY